MDFASTVHSLWQGKNLVVRESVTLQTVAGKSLLWQGNRYFDRESVTLAEKGLLWQRKDYFDRERITFAGKGLISVRFKSRTSYR